MNMRPWMLTMSAGLALSLATLASWPTASIEEVAAQPVPQLIASAASLPSRSYVLSNGSVVASKPEAAPRGLVGADNAITPVGQTIRVAVTVVPSRLIVVDEQETIIEVYSNTDGVGIPYYQVVVRQGYDYGTERPLTAKILEQYNQLQPKVDWSSFGKVY